MIFPMTSAAGADMTVEVTGYQWNWHYKYPQTGVEFFPIVVLFWRDKSQHQEEDCFCYKTDGDSCPTPGLAIDLAECSHHNKRCTDTNNQIFQVLEAL